MALVEIDINYDFGYSSFFIFHFAEKRKIRNHVLRRSIAKYRTMGNAIKTRAMFAKGMRSSACHRQLVPALTLAAKSKVFPVARRKFPLGGEELGFWFWRALRFGHIVVPIQQH